jgi:hypothetical protein
VAILGFSSSGKTVYLTMLYYETSIRGASQSDTSQGSVVSGGSGYQWRADWLTMDGGITIRYLNDLYRKIAGVDFSGRKIFKPGSRKELVREMPGGTQTHQDIQFRLICNNGIREHGLDIHTLEGAGEVLQAYAADPTSISIENRARWEQFKTVCAKSDAILLFFNLLKMDLYDDQGPFKTLIDTLVNQPRKPRAVAIVITGTDILPDELAIEQRRQKFRADYQKGLGQLTASKIPYDIFMLTSYGRSFTRQKPYAEIGDTCREPNHYRCKDCQELVPDVEARPDPKDLLAPWDFIYEKVYHRGDWYERMMGFGEKAASLKWYLAGAAAGLMALVAVGAVVATKQKERALEIAIAGAPAPQAIAQAAAIDEQLGSNPIYRLFAANPAKLPEEAPRFQLQRFIEAREAFDNRTLAIAVRLEAAEKAILVLKPPFSDLVPVEALRLEKDVGGISSAKLGWVKRIQSADAALALPERSAASRAAVEESVARLLAEIDTWCARTAEEVAGRVASDRPARGDDASRAEMLLQLQQELEKDQIGRTKAGRELLTRVSPLRKDLALLADFQRLADLPEQSADQASIKQKAFEKFRLEHGMHALANAAGDQATELAAKVRRARSAEAFGSLPAYDAALVVRDLPQFIESFRRVQTYLSAFGKSDQADAARDRLAQMRADFDSEFSRIEQQVADELAQFRQHPPRKQGALGEEEAGYRATLALAQNLRTLSPLLGNGGVASRLAPFDQLASYQKEYANLARILGSNPEDDSQRQAAADALKAFAARLPADHPARELAVSEQSALEMRVLFNRLQASLDKLPKSEAFSVETSDTVFTEVLASYAAFLRSGDGLLSTQARRDRFAAFTASINQPSPLEEGLRRRAIIQKRFDERRLWAQIEAAAGDPDRKLGREQTLALIDKLTGDFPDSALLRDATRRRATVEAWRQVGYRCALDVETPAGFYELTLMVRSEKSTQPLARSAFPLRGGRAAQDATFSFSAWSDQTIEVVVEVRRSGERLPLYLQRRMLPSGRHDEELTRAFPTENGIRVRLTQKSGF